MFCNDVLDKLNGWLTRLYTTWSKPGGLVNTSGEDVLVLIGWSIAGGTKVGLG